MTPAWLHRVLEVPVVYRLVQAIAGGGENALSRIYDEEFGATRGLVLDVGCGPTPDIPLSAGTLVGLDVNPGYVANYRASNGDATSYLGVVGSGARIPFRDGEFDECRCAALLHHLSDDLAREALREMYRAVRSQGRVAVFDMIQPRSFWSSPLAWLVCRADRGEWVRSEEALVALARSACSGDWRVRTFSYTWMGLRGMVLFVSKS